MDYFQYIFLQFQIIKKQDPNISWRWFREQKQGLGSFFGFSSDTGSSFIPQSNSQSYLSIVFTPRVEFSVIFKAQKGSVCSKISALRARLRKVLEDFLKCRDFLIQQVWSRANASAFFKTSPVDSFVQPESKSTQL